MFMNFHDCLPQRILNTAQKSHLLPQQADMTLSTLITFQLLLSLQNISPISMKLMLLSQTSQRKQMPYMTIQHFYFLHTKPKSLAILSSPFLTSTIISCVLNHINGLSVPSFQLLLALIVSSAFRQLQYTIWMLCKINFLFLCDTLPQNSLAYSAAILWPRKCEQGSIGDNGFFCTLFCLILLH